MSSIFVRNNNDIKGKMHNLKDWYDLFIQNRRWKNAQYLQFYEIL